MLREKNIAVIKLSTGVGVPTKAVWRAIGAALTGIGAKASPRKKKKKKKKKKKEVFDSTSSHQKI